MMTRASLAGAVALLLSLVGTPPGAAAPRAPASPAAPSVTATLPAEFQAPDAPVELPPIALLQVSAPDEDLRSRLRALDLDVIDERPGHSARVLAWPGTREALAAAGFAYDVLEDDYGRALARNAGGPPSPLDVSSARAALQAPAVSPPLGQGSLGGYHTLAEIEAFLDDLAANDPHGIVGTVTQIGLSRQGRPIKALRIAKESLPDHSRPRALFTGLHHAREPIGMTAVLEFMRRLTTDYGVDPNVTWIVDNRETWFVPVVNPDGYLINQNSWFNSGSFGLWRKNARDNDSNGLINTQDGVDLNRNYGWFWGYDNAGSSPLVNSMEYRGTTAFSEPETRAMRDFAVAHQFSVSNHYHTYGEFYLYPWGYNAAGCPDSLLIRRAIEKMTTHLSYSYGLAGDLLYRTNGDANDWFYGEQGTKPKCISLTPEVGDKNDGFWPPAARIVPLAAAHFQDNLYFAYMAGVHAWAEGAEIVSPSGWFYPGGACQVSLTLRNTGLLATTGNVQVVVTSPTPGITVTDAVSTFGPIASNGLATPLGGDLLGLSAAISVPSGTSIPLHLTITDQGGYAFRDTVEILIGQPVVALFDDAGAGTGKWTISSRWGIQTVNGDPMFSDSPTGKYTTIAVANMTLTAPLDLSGAGRAWLTFRTFYDIEVGADAGRVQVSTDGGMNWTSLSGRMTRPGHGQTGAYANGTQALGEPVYDGTQRFEATEAIDLSAYAGLSDVRLRFRFTTDDTGRRDGWLVDDIAVLAYPDLSTGVPDEAPIARRPEVGAAHPNPFAGRTRFEVRFAEPTVFEAAVFSVDGRRVRPLAEGLAAAGVRELEWDGRLADGRDAPAGVYFVRVNWTGGSASRRVVRMP